MENQLETPMKTGPGRLFLALLALLALVPAGLAEMKEKHSLTYIYTAFSKPAGLPGIHEFTAMGLVDDTMIDYFDSDLKEKVPKQPWMAEKMDENYWIKGTQSRLSKQTWFRVNIDILMGRMRQNDTDTHILQWQHGCESITENGVVKFYEGKDTYNYDGEDFLHFDDKHGRWVSANPVAQDTKRKWDAVQTLKDYTKGYLENECLSWLNQFVEYGRKQHQAAPPPEMFMFAKKSKTDGNVLTLTCLASGFLQKDAELKIRRKGQLLDKVNGVKSSRVRPNNDDTYQMRHSVEILRTDESEYTCEVMHEGSGLSAKVTWDHKLPTEDSGLIIYVGAGLSLLFIGIFVGLSVWLSRSKGYCGGGKKDQDDQSKDSSQNINLMDNGSKGSGSSSSTDSGSGSSSSTGSTVSTDSGETKESKIPSEVKVLLEAGDHQ